MSWEATKHEEVPPPPTLPPVANGSRQPRLRICKLGSCSCGAKVCIDFLGQKAPKRADEAQPLGAAVATGRKSLPAVGYIDTHVHLEEVLCYAQRSLAVPSLAKKAAQLTAEEKELWKILGLEEDSAGTSVVASGSWDQTVVDTYQRVWDRDWAQLTAAEQQAAMNLGYSAELWDHGSWILPRRVSWESLDGDMQRNLVQLGETAATWDRWNSCAGSKQLRGSSRSTARSPEAYRRQSSPTSRGQIDGEWFGSHSWDADLEQRRSKIWSWSWRDLSVEEREAAEALGYSEEAWDRSDWLLPKHVHWEALDEEVRRSLETLGEGKLTWDRWNQSWDGTSTFHRGCQSNGHRSSSSSSTTSLVGGKEASGEDASASMPWPKLKGMAAFVGAPSRPWQALSEPERKAATALGFSKTIWDLEELADVHTWVNRSFGPEFEGCITQGCDGDSIDQAVHLAQTHPKVYVSFGCHPKSVWSYNDELEKRLLAAAESCGKKAVAWGEFGLDYSHPYFGPIATNRQAQREVFARQLRLAVSRGWPLVIHSRAADRDTLRMMRQFVPRHWRVHIHSYRGGVPFLEILLEEWDKTYIGVSGLVTLNDAHANDLAKRCPLERMLLETDAPYLPVLGHSYSHPGLVPSLAKAVANLRGASVEEVLKVTRENARIVYGI